VKRLTALVSLVALLAALVLLGVADSAASIAATSIPNNEVASTVSEAGNSDSGSGTTTITMRTPPLPGSVPRIPGLAIS